MVLYGGVGAWVHVGTHGWVTVCVFVFVCRAGGWACVLACMFVRERERERQRKRAKKSAVFLLLQKGAWWRTFVVVAA